MNNVCLLGIDEDTRKKKKKKKGNEKSRHGVHGNEKGRKFFLVKRKHI